MKQDLIFRYEKFHNIRMAKKSFLLMISFGLFVYSCQKIDLDSRKIFTASGNKNLPFSIEIEGRDYSYHPEKQILWIRYPIWYRDPFFTCEACRQWIRVAEAEILLKSRPILTKRTLYEVRRSDAWEDWFPNEGRKLIRPESQITRSDLNSELKKQIRLRTVAYPELSIRLLMDHFVDVHTKVILYSAFSNETTAEVRELCLVRESKIVDCFFVSNSDFDFLSLGKNRYLLAESYRGTNFRYFEIYKDRFVLEDKSISRFVFDGDIYSISAGEGSIREAEWEIETFR
ncbi:hypothetical protein ACO1KB_13615 [Leptospira interrogans serovar Szwajizak]|uniref:hypothetical protein n=1 Tax=Leptospira interrogans TaxID=173 RepID=UPI0003487425|nr:hypothetical protein [Leptospira interrogans]